MRGERAFSFFPHGPRELWFRWSELWSRVAPMTGSFPEHVASECFVSLSLSSITRVSFPIFFSSSFFSLFFLKIASLPPHPYNTSYPPLDERTLSASPTKKITVEKSSWKKMWSSIALGKNSSLSDLRWYTWSRPEWLYVAMLYISFCEHYLDDILFTDRAQSNLTTEAKCITNEK